MCALLPLPLPLPLPLAPDRVLDLSRRAARDRDPWALFDPRGGIKSEPELSVHWRARRAKRIQSVQSALQQLEAGPRPPPVGSGLGEEAEPVAGGEAVCCCCWAESADELELRPHAPHL